MRQLELREADIDQKQQVLRDMKNKIERNAAIVDELESDIGQLMEAKGNRLQIITYNLITKFRSTFF